MSSKINADTKIEVINPGDKRFEFVIKEYQHRNIDSSIQHMILYKENDYIYTITLLNEKIKLIKTDSIYYCIRINNIIYLFYLNKNGSKLQHIEYTNQANVLSPEKIKEITDTNNIPMILLKKYSILYINYKPNKIDIKNEKLTEAIKNINRILEKKNLRIVLDFIYNIDRKIYSLGIDTDKLILCLMKKSSDSSCSNTDGQEQCISSITFNFYTKDIITDVKEHIDFISDNDNIAEISSFTKPVCEKRSYNKLLISILVTVLHLILVNGKQINTLHASIANIISAWLLISTYYTTYHLYDNPEKYSSAPEEFKGVRPYNIFNTLKKPVSNKNKNSLQNNKNKSKKNTKNTLSGNNNKAKIKQNIEKYKSILPNIEEIFIDINPVTEIGKENIAIAERKIDEFVSK